MVRNQCSRVHRNTLRRSAAGTGEEGLVRGSYRIRFADKNGPGRVICVFLLILVLSVAATASLLFRILYGIVTPDMLLIYYPGEAWIAAAVLFVLALCSLACVASTIAGIAITDLYSYGKTGQVPGGNNNHPIAITTIGSSASKSRNLFRIGKGNCDHAFFSSSTYCDSSGCYRGIRCRNKNRIRT